MGFIESTMSTRGAMMLIPSILSSSFTGALGNGESQHCVLETSGPRLGRPPYRLGFHHGAMVFGQCRMGGKMGWQGATREHA
jgi:hypothetical protein